MADKPAPPLARRIAAARVYSGKSRQQLGKLIGRSAGQVGRYERGDWEKEPPGIAIIQAIARHTQVPEWFFETGFPDDGAGTTRAGGGAPPIPGETGRRAAGPPPTDQGHEQPGSDRDTG